MMAPSSADEARADSKDETSNDMRLFLGHVLVPKVEQLLGNKFYASFNLRSQGLGV